MFGFSSQMGSKEGDGKYGSGGQDHERIVKSGVEEGSRKCGAWIVMVVKRQQNLLLESYRNSKVEMMGQDW